MDMVNHALKLHKRRRLRVIAKATIVLVSALVLLWLRLGPALVCGLAVIGAVVAFAGYWVSLVGWRWWISRKWRHRQKIPTVVN